MSVTRCQTVIVTALALVSGSVASAAIDRNTTGLPTYPHVTHAIMDPVLRDTIGRKCIHYVADSEDRLEAVEEWYRHALPNAAVSDVNRNSLYGEVLKLTGIRLTLGNDFITLYRTENGRTTSIELFKCAPPGS